MDTISTGAVRYIATLTDVTALLGSFPATDTVNGGQPYLFAEDIDVTISGTASAALVCSDMGTTSAAPPLTTPQFFRLAITIWVDPLRDSAFNFTESAGATIKRGKKIFTQLNFHLHRTTGDTQQWGDIVTASSQLLIGPQFAAVRDLGPPGMQERGTTSHPQVGTAYYGVSVFGYTDQQG